MAQDLSPVTGILEEELVVIDFGEHEGKSVLEVNIEHPDFYTELIQARELGNFSIRRFKDKSFRLYATFKLAPSELN